MVDVMNWASYNSGIFQNCEGNDMNYGILVVGVTETYWKVKNSWGQQHVQILQLTSTKHHTMTHRAFQ